MDEKGKVLGIYTASEARKKAVNMKMDMVMVSNNTMPPVCKVSNFREGIIARFYQEVVLKRQK